MAQNHTLHDVSNEPKTDSPRPPGESRPIGPILRTIVSLRFVFALAVVGTFVASVLLIVHGTVLAVNMVLQALRIGAQHEDVALRTEALEMVDIYLVATVLYVISMGFYQLLLAPDIPLPRWLVVRSPADLESKLIGVLVTVMGVEVLVTLNSWNGTSNLLAYGITSALVIAALAFYVWVHSTTRDHDDD